MANIPITGYPSSWRAPFTAVQIDFGQGPSTASGGKRRVVYFGPMTSAGTWTAGTAYKVTRESDARDGAGPGSPLHRMARLHLLADKDADITAVPYAASSGSGVATATGTVTVAMDSGSNPTASGTLYVTVCGVQLTIGFTTSDTATTIGDAIAAQVNAQTQLPCTAANASGTATLTAKVPGASQGDGTTGVIRFRASVDSGKNVTVATSGAALGLGTGTAGADGATTELSNLTSALAGFTNTAFYYMGFSVWTAADLAPVKTHVANKSEPNPGKRCAAWFGYTGTQASLVTIANGLNFERMHAVWQLNSETDTAELCANAIAVHRKLESIQSDFVPDNYRGTNWLIPKAYAESDWPTDTDINDAIVDGITPIGSDNAGAFIVMSVSTRSKNAAGTVDDFRAAERHRVSFCDYFGDTWVARDQNTYQGFKLQADQLTSDGNVNTNQRIPRKTLTPSRYKSWFAGIIDEFVDAGMFQDRDAWLESLQTDIDPLNNSRLETGVSGRTVDIRHQASLRLSETSPG